MKKILPFLLSAVLTISLTGCKNEHPGETELPKNDDVIIIEVTTAPISETLTETEAEIETSAAAAETTEAKTTAATTAETTTAKTAAMTEKSVTEKITASAEAISETETTEIFTEAATAASKTSTDYILNTNTKKFHYPRCYSASQISDKNKREYSGDRDGLIAQSYKPCQKCKP